MKRKKGFIHEKTRMSAKVREFNTASFLRVPSWIDIFFILLDGDGETGHKKPAGDRAGPDPGAGRRDHRPVRQVWVAGDRGY